MSERYLRLFSSPENLYSEGSPILIAAGALLKDSLLGDVLVQLKLRNISSKRMKSVIVEISSLDVTGIAIGEPIEYQYLDIDVRRDDEFGQKVPIVLPNNVTRGFTVSVKRVIFNDNSFWEGTDDPWTSLEHPISLESALNDHELVKQYKIEFGNLCTYMPCRYKDLWYCGCGALNRQDEAVCHECQNRWSVFANVDFRKMSAERDERLLEEEKQAAILRAEQEEQRKRNKKIALIAGGIVSVFLVVIIIAQIIIATKPGRVLSRAEKLAQSGDLMAAVQLLDDLNMPEKTGQARSTYINMMRSEVENAIADKEYTTAIALLDEYTALNSRDRYIDNIQSNCTHKYGEMESSDYTCTVDGYKRQTCTICSYVDEEIFKAPGHTYSATVTKAATCTEKGESVDVCSVCGEKQNPKAVDALGHDYAQKVTKGATCTTAGTATFTCKRCSDSYTGTINATGHNYSAATCTAAAKCKTCGVTNGAALGHTSSNGKCSRCGYNSMKPVTLSLNYSFSSHGAGELLTLDSGKYKATVTVSGDDCEFSIVRGTNAAVYDIYKKECNGASSFTAYFTVADSSNIIFSIYADDRINGKASASVTVSAVN